MPDAGGSWPKARPWENQAESDVGPKASSVPASVLDALLATSEVLESRLGEPSALSHSDARGTSLVTKLWYARGAFSSDRLLPYSSRFVRAARRLRELGIVAPTLRFHGRVAGRDVRFVTYERLSGRPLRGLGERIDLQALARFVLRLHDIGVYFRGLHLGNVIQTDEGVLALIDVADTRFRRGALSRRQRERNLGILCAHPQDLPFMLEGNWSDLVAAYCFAAGMTLAEAAQVREGVRRQVERRNTRRSVVRRRRGLAPLPDGGYPRQD